ncbi:PIN2/TERF1-interacting telomerase inhibitor 1 isoform X2 [Hippoglossus hippoglossus]|uniref:PIN2/TERF1-interacting telomerase inhibitor 1 isoform X2 n=1 Tax=Hippoglossus hippoglossus TaxID=8267 RepID=UPI00148C133E|nr:PIN2/TERF1-interacting telomerase inhibitor 1 isoform X2 [Hippoglossus hippoglossus]
MSMLAEPRRKQKWSVDPRNSAWSKDESKFGQKMLERMGWSKGKGLGRTEQGSTDHIKVKVKNNSYGFGTSASYEDNWIAHQDDFNELLAQLNNCHGQNNSKDPPPDEQKGFSLEEKSKTSKKRVHYMKFTKGKDLSSRSENDLNCIFGKRAQSTKEQEQESTSSDSQAETEEKVTIATSELDTEAIAQTVTSTLTMQEYFAQRMAQLKKARGQDPRAAFRADAETSETSTPSEEPIHSSNNDAEEPKKKKKKKKKRATNELEVVEDNCSSPIVVEDNENQEQERKKKKKKRKMAENEGASAENCSSTSGVEQNCEEQPPSKKKKLKKHKKETELLNGHEPSDDQTVESEVVPKKKHREEEEGDVVEVVVQKKSKKKKKKKKHQE